MTKALFKNYKFGGPPNPQNCCLGIMSCTLDMCAYVANVFGTNRFRLIVNKSLMAVDVESEVAAINTRYVSI